MKFFKGLPTALLSSFVFLSIISSCRTESIPKAPQNPIEATSLPESIEDPSAAKWKRIDKVARKLSATLVKNVLPFAVRSAGEMNLSSSCSRGLMKFLTGVKQLKLWAIAMLDASGKIPNGMFKGSLNSLGDYDECIETDVPGHFRGQYCLLDIVPPLPKRRRFVPSETIIKEFVNVTDPESAIGKFITFGNHYYHLNFRTSVCVPSTCNGEEIQKISQKVLEQIGLEFSVTVPNCEIKMETFTFSTSEIVIIIVFSLLLFLGLTATITDVWLKLKSDEEFYQETLSFPIRCLLCFSFYTNTVRLLKKDKSPDSIKIFHGMKVITILWVILNHTYYYLNFQAFSELLNAQEMGKEKAFQLIANGFLNVETFFFISAVLVSYGVMNMKEERLNVFLYIFRRFWRLTPPFMFIIAAVYLLPYVGSGPVWKETITDRLAEKCKETWWTNLLYINNFLPNSQMCLQWMWYIPVDTHLYFLSLFVLIPLKKNPRIAFLINGVIFVSGTIISAVLNVHYGLHPTAIYVYNHPEDISYYIERGYFRTYLHCSSYCVGLTVGYLIATRRKFYIPLRVNLIGWLLAFLSALTVLYGVYDWNQGNVPGIVVSTLYTCTNKFVWSLALAWVTFACVTGNGGIATTVLSWEAFVPFGRLTYMAYLVHPIIQLIYIGSTRTLIVANHRTLVFMYFSNVVCAFMCAYVLSLLFESPFMALEKVFFGARSHPREKTTKSKSKNNSDIFCDKKENDCSVSHGDNGICAIKVKYYEGYDA
ncbi:nose resistant to fluoxetine protein 6 [Nephila pilipes]|uniref:Nose resistant to fluoxetine protein 6 n=1 Tax=Nephila pilipes TaxID=299642 RepID=A0A8X6R016_NEPPI|nr:nose resistant to fluoxetine protein 6 [Nephila pilipes]